MSKVTDYADIPMKKPNIWATLYGHSDRKHYGDNLKEISKELSRQYPNAKNEKEMWAVLQDAYGNPPDPKTKGYGYQLLDKSYAPISQGKLQLRDPTPWNPWSKWNTTFVPTEQQMAEDPRAAEAYAPDRRFGVLAHEMRHLIATQHAPGFHADVRGSDRESQLQDSMGNQIDHFPGGFTDRDMANALKVLRFSQMEPPPDYIRVTNPWMGAKEKPTIDDLMKYIGQQPGWKR